MPTRQFVGTDKSNLSSRDAKPNHKFRVLLAEEVVTRAGAVIVIVVPSPAPVPRGSVDCFRHTMYLSTPTRYLAYRSNRMDLPRQGKHPQGFVPPAPSSTVLQRRGLSISSPHGNIASMVPAGMSGSHSSKA